MVRDLGAGSVNCEAILCNVIPKHHFKPTSQKRTTKKKLPFDGINLFPDKEDYMTKL